MKARSLPIRRGLSAAESALYLGIGETLFRELVTGGRMPKPRRIGTRRLWDIDSLDAAFRDLPVEGEAEEADSWADLEPKSS